MRHLEESRISYGRANSEQMERAAGESSRMGDLTAVRTPWRQMLADRAQADFMKLFREAGNKRRANGIQ